MQGNKVGIIQARMTSTRLPGKVLKTVLGKPLLQYQLERLARCQQIDTLVVATTTNATDDPVVALCQQLGVATFRGSENDVLERYFLAARAFQADWVIRMTADCPVIDPGVVDAVITQALQANPPCDYVSNTLERTFPRGLDTEVFSFRALAEAMQEACLPAEREHVTPFIYTRPERYRVGQYKQALDWSAYRWTVDTPEDFELIRRMLEALMPVQPEFTLGDMVALLEQHSDWSALNADVEQVKLSQA